MRINRKRFVIQSRQPVQADSRFSIGKIHPTKALQLISHQLIQQSCTVGRRGQGRREWGGVGGVTPPLKTSCRQMKGFVGKRKIIYHKTLS
jgi:hypothetical protein